MVWRKFVIRCSGFMVKGALLVRIRSELCPNAEASADTGIPVMFHNYQPDGRLSPSAVALPLASHIETSCGALVIAGFVVELAARLNRNVHNWSAKHASREGKRAEQPLRAHNAESLESWRAYVG